MDTGFDLSIKEYIGFTFAIVLVIIGWLELRIRNKLLKQQLQVSKDRLEFEKESLDKRTKWIERQELSMDLMSEPLADNLARRLIEESSWAARAMEKAKIGPYTDTLFGDRKDHFPDEKEAIAEKFVPLLLKRCRHLIEQENKRVCLLIDAGTTLHPFFKHIAKITVTAFSNNDNWITSDQPSLPASERSKLMIVTNNLPGVEDLMRLGRTSRERYSDLAVHCELLPGTALPVFSSVTGKKTENAIMALHQDLTCIALVTGNWVRFRRNMPRCPIPMARGSGHLESKQAFINRSDEVYVVAPLGKIFANVGPEQVNPLLNFQEDASNQEMRSYRELHIDESTANKVKLISTTRKENRLLHPLSTYLCGQLGESLCVDPGSDLSNKNFVSAQAGKSSHIFFNFDKLPTNLEEQKECEFPHRHTRTDNFISLFTDPSKSRQLGTARERGRREYSRSTSYGTNKINIQSDTVSRMATLLDYCLNDQGDYYGIGIIVDTTPDQWKVDSNVTVDINNSKYRGTIRHRRYNAGPQRLGIKLSKLYTTS